jgi:hypothetical protein
MKPDERQFLGELRRRSADEPQPTPWSDAAELGVPPKRTLLLCQGWWARRWLERAPDTARGDDFVTGKLTAAGMTGDLRRDLGRHYVRCWQAGSTRSPYAPVP